MAIVITTNDKAGITSVQTYDNKEDAKKAVHQVVEVTKDEKTNETSASSQENNETSKDEFDYFNKSNEEDDQNEDDLDIEEDDESTEEDQKPKKNGFKKRIDKLTKRNSEFEQKIAQLEAQLKAGTPQTPDQKVEKPIIEELKEPKIQDFEEYSEYVKELAKYQINEENKKSRLNEENKKIEEEAQNVMKKWQERVEDAKKFYGESEWEKLSKIDLPMTNETRYVLMDTEIGPHMLYYLFHNPEEAKKIATLPAIKQVNELTKIQLKLESKLPEIKKAREDKKISKAPPPVKTIETSKSHNIGSKDPNKMSFQEYKAWRKNK